jgi:dihydrofolate synthase / folylpolyglutamate synthase
LSSRASLLSLEQFGIKLGLEQIRALLVRLGHPEHAFPSVVVAGTNGKGSVTAMVERGLRASGHRTGRYISPHLVHLEERFAIDGASIPPADLDRTIARVMTAAEGMDAPPTFFEATTAVALEAFREAGVDAAVLEVGLGGRLDATNVVASAGVAITSIDFDHEAYLGHTLEDIASEKAGIIKPGGLAILAENSATVCRVVIDIATAMNARLIYAPEGVTTEARMEQGRVVASVRTPRGDYPSLALALRGWHQLTNAITAMRLLEELSAAGTFAVPPAAVRTAVEKAEWPARLELIGEGDQAVLIDGAHNPAGARALASYVDEVFGRPLPIVVGAMRDKKIDAVIQALAGSASVFVCTAVDSPRAATPGELADAVARAAPSVPAVRAADPKHALAMARTIGAPVIVAGSLYLAGEIRADLS